jgi:hypothetical protein
MTEKEKMLALFDPALLSPKFKALCEHCFDNGMEICQGFEMYSDQADALQYFLPAEKLAKHKNDFVIIGQATHSGSLYAFYKAGGKTQDEWPVVVFGDEGGALVLAKDMGDFLRFLSLNVEPYVGSDYETNTNKFDLYLSEEEEEESPLQDYIEWIEGSYKLNRVTSIEQANKEIIKPAQQLYQAKLDLIVKATE